MIAVTLVCCYAACWGPTKERGVEDVTQHVEHNVSRTDLDYASRVDHLMNGGGLNGDFLLNATTVFNDNAKDKLRGKKGLDWFLADDDKVDGGLDELLSLIELDFVNAD